MLFLFWCQGRIAFLYLFVFKGIVMINKALHNIEQKRKLSGIGEKNQVNAATERDQREKSLEEK